MSRFWHLAVTRVAALRDWLVGTAQPRRSHTASDRGAASLVEVMIAMVISAVLLASVLGLLDSASTVAQSMEMRAETEERVSILRDRMGSVVQSSTEPLRCVAGSDIATTSTTTSTTATGPVTDDRTDPTCTQLEAFDTPLISASSTEVCGLARSKAPVTVSADAPALGDPVVLRAPRAGCVRIEDSIIVYTFDSSPTSTTSAAANVELILTNASEAGFQYFTAESDQLLPEEATGLLSDTDRLSVRRVVFVAIIESRQGRMTEDVRVEFALGAARFGAEQSWKGRIGASPPSRDNQ